MVAQQVYWLCALVCRQTVLLPVDCHPSQLNNI